MKDTTAIRPDFYFKQMPSMRDADAEAEKKGIGEDERDIYAMTQMRGWVLMRTYMDQLYKDLSEVNKTAISNGASLEEIGRNTVVVSLTQDILDKVLNKADDALEACTQNEQ